MSEAWPDSVDPWRMAAQGRCFEKRLPLLAMPRLGGLLAATEGALVAAVEFGREADLVWYVRVRVEGRLPLTCQRSGKVFDFPIAVDSRLGLMRQEADEAALPPGYEPLLVQGDSIRPTDVVEDELILALPLVPVAPGSEGEDAGVLVYSSEPESVEPPHPFAALAALRKN